MPNTGTNTDYASLMPDLSDNANIQEAIQSYHYGTIDPTEVDSANFLSPSGFGDPNYGMVGKLKWIKTEIDTVKAAGANGGIFNSIIDAKGDLIVGTADNTPAKLSAGTNGYVLQVDTSNVTYGLKWANISDTHLSLNGGTLVGNLDIVKTSGNSILTLQSVSGSTKGINIKTGSSLRWEILSNSTSESSTATGSDLIINRYNNSGSLLGTVLTITRSSGLVTFTNNVTITGTLTVSSDATFTSNAIVSTAPTSSSHLTNKQYVDNSMPVGAIVAYAGSSVPTGWVVCNGQAVSRTTYAGLFAVCGTYYGSGDNSTTFNVPDLRDRFVRGGETRGTAGGSNTISISNMPAHDHGSSTALANATHSHGGSTSSNGDHTHTINLATRQIYTGSGGLNAAYSVTNGSGTSVSGAHTHSIFTDVQNASHSHGISSQGSGTSYWQPHYQMIYIIKGI